MYVRIDKATGQIILHVNIQSGGKIAHLKVIELIILCTALKNKNKNKI